MAGIRYNSGYNVVPRDSSDIILWLFLSVALHAILATLFALSPDSSKKIIYVPVYEVDLVPAPDVVKAEPPVSIQQEVRPIEEPKPPMVARKARKSSKVVAMPKALRKAVKPDEAISKMREKVAAEEAVDRIRKKMREKEPATTSASGSGVKIAQKAPARVYQYEELDAELRAYFDKISRAVMSAWFLPDSLRNKGYKAVLSIHVLRDGTVESLWIEEGSGNRYYDDSAMRAINKINPLPPLPKGWREEYIDLGLRF